MCENLFIFGIDELERQRCERDGGNVATSIHKDHQCRTDGNRRKTADARINDNHADTEYEQEYADEFNKIFFII